MLFVQESGTIRSSVILGSSAQARNVNFVVAIPLSFGVDAVDQTPTSIEVTSVRTYTFALGDLDPDFSFQVNFTVTPTTEGFFTSTVEATLDNQVSDASILTGSVEHEVFDRTGCAAIPSPPAVTIDPTSITRRLLFTVIVTVNHDPVSLSIFTAGASLSLLVTVVGRAISIRLGTNSGGTSNTTAAQLKTAIAASGPASALVTCTTPTGTDTGLVQPITNPATFFIQYQGGNLFDCLDDGPYEEVPLTGHEVTDQFVGDSPFGFYQGDHFEDYSVGAYAGGTPGASVTGLTEIFVG